MDKHKSDNGMESLKYWKKIANPELLFSLVESFFKK